MEEQKNTVIIVGLRAGRIAGEISEFNKLRRSLCYRIKKGFYDCIAVGEDLDDVSAHRKTHQMRRDAIRTPEFIDMLQNMIDQDFEEGLRVNTDGLRVSADAYIHVMDTVVKPWMEGAAGDRHYAFQQDGAPAHNANKTQAWLEENPKEAWPKNTWPPSSPDCNPYDYFPWGVCEREVNKRPHNTEESLKTKITEVMARLDKTIMVNACRRFHSRIERVPETEDRFIE